MGDTYIGFANLANQIHRHATEDGFTFNIAVVGESGLGKSTLLNTLFLSDVYVDEDYPKPGEEIPQTIEVKKSTVNIEENGVQVQLTLVDTPGFGSFINNEECWSKIVSAIDDSYESYLNDESRANRSSVVDRRIHCCLYFIAPNGHGLKPLDIQVMKKLQRKVNIVPLIAKADALTEQECMDFKMKILNDIEENGIEIYQFPAGEDNTDEGDPQSYVPFAVCASNTTMDVGGTSIRGRQYPWGIVEIENERHCDFAKLRDLLIRTHLQNLIDVTHETLYENYRLAKLSSIAGADANSTSSQNGDTNLLDQFEKQKLQQEAKMKKMETDMTLVFEKKVAEKEKKLKESEMRLQQQYEQMQRELHSQNQQIEQKMKMFEDEKRLAADRSKEAAAAKTISSKSKKGVRLF